MSGRGATWTGAAAKLVAAQGPAVRVLVVRADGSAPREAGTAMLVTASGIEGTIGGGALEHAAIATARTMLRDMDASGPWARAVRHYPLGPTLGQCCGGHVRLLFEVLRAAECASLGDLPGDEPGLLVRPVAAGAAPSFAQDRRAAGDRPLQVTRVVRDMLAGRRPAGFALVAGRRGAGDWVIEPVGRADTPLWLYGAGHVGRALVRVLEGLAFDVTWVDIDRARFPDTVPAHATPLVAADPAAVVGEAPAGAVHIVMTFSHALDLAICHGVLVRGDFAYLGLIGSATKRARFVKRLAEMGIAQPAIVRLICPIGLGSITSKAPAAIAVAVAADLIERREAIAGRSAYVGTQPRIDAAARGGDAG